MNGLRVYYAKCSKSEKDKYHMVSLYVESKEQNEQNRNRLTDTENRLMVARWEVTGVLGEKVEGVRRTNW